MHHLQDGTVNATACSVWGGAAIAGPYARCPVVEISPTIFGDLGTKSRECLYFLGFRGRGGGPKLLSGDFFETFGVSEFWILWMVGEISTRLTKVSRQRRLQILETLGKNDEPSMAWQRFLCTIDMPPCPWTLQRQLPLGVPNPGCFKPCCLQNLRSFAIFCALLRSFADLRLHSFALICVFLRTAAFRTTAFGNSRFLIEV